MKAVLANKFIVANVHIAKTEPAQINDLVVHLEVTEKQEQSKSRTCVRKQISKIRAAINEIWAKKTIQRII